MDERLVYLANLKADGMTSAAEEAELDLLVQESDENKKYVSDIMALKDTLTSINDDIAIPEGFASDVMKRIRAQKRARRNTVKYIGSFIAAAACICIAIVGIDKFSVSNSGQTSGLLAKESEAAYVSNDDAPLAMEDINDTGEQNVEEDEQQLYSFSSAVPDYEGGSISGIAALMQPPPVIRDKGSIPLVDILPSTGLLSNNVSKDELSQGEVTAVSEVTAVLSVSLKDGLSEQDVISALGYDAGQEDIMVYHLDIEWAGEILDGLGLEYELISGSEEEPLYYELVIDQQEDDTGAQATQGTQEPVEE